MNGLGYLWEPICSPGKILLEKIMKSQHLRIARPTDRLEEVVDFYVRVLGYQELGRFEDHDGFDGVMVGHSDAPYHLEFTRARGHTVGEAPTKDHLLVLYIPDHQQWLSAITRIEENGCSAVKSFNPYWDQNGKTFADPDGYRIVIQNAQWC